MSDSLPDTDNELLDGLLGDFLDESDQLLTQLNANLLQLDEWVQALDEDHHQRCDEGLMNEMFRAAHSLKGLSGMLGLADINQLTHKIENVFDAARHDQLAVTRDVTELMFMGFDQLTAMIGLLKEPDSQPVNCDAVLEAIRRLLEQAGAEKELSTQADAERALGEGEAEAEKGDSPHLPERPGGCFAQMGTVPFFHADPFEAITDESDIPENYLSMFVDEAETALDALTTGLLTVEGGTSTDDLKHLLGTAHKIKGSAASVGLNRAAKLAHLMEDLFEKTVAAGSSLSAPTSDVLLKCVDGLRRHVTDLRRGGRDSDHFGPLARNLLAAQPSFPAPGAAAPPEPAPPMPVERDVQAATERVMYLGEVIFQPDLFTAGLKAQLIYEKLLKLGDVSECQPTFEQLDTIDHLERFRFRVATEHPADAVAAQLRIGGVAEVRMEPEVASPAIAESSGGGPFEAEQSGPPAAQAETASSAPDAPRPPAEANPRTATAGHRPVETVRVDTDRLDQLMDLAGQLVISKAQFSQIGGRLKAVVDCNQAVRALEKLSGELDKLGSGDALRVDARHLSGELESVRAQARRLRGELEPIRREVQTFSQARDSVRELFEAIHQLDRVSDAVQKGVMDIRMVPIGPLFARFQRVVRDVSRAGGKQVRLQILGEKTELDKRMIDELGDPLVHLVRNSADHGIEPPEAREVAGKPRHGIVTLNAFHRGNNIVIEVRDDGIGLDNDRILRKALDKGVVTEADAQRMTAQQIQQLIWEPGLSTAEKVTDVSGRGMGMDIVKAKIEELSGKVEIASERGQGTTITLKLPLTLAILPSLMVDIGGDVFAMPMEAVTEIASVARHALRTVHGHPMATVRGRVISLLNLTDLLKFHRAQRAAENGRGTETTLVVVGDAGREVGLAVDRVIGEEDVVIKSIAENYQNVRGIAGASVLGDGRVALILDIPALMAARSGQAEYVTA